MGRSGSVAIGEHDAQSPSLVRLVREAQRPAPASPAALETAGSGIPEPDDEGPLYVARRKVYPQRVKGTYRTIKWIVLCITLGIYYGLPFLRWDRGLNAPNQAVLVDLPSRRLYFFFVEIWPQEVYYLTGLLIIAALTLFLMNAVAGRVWCGYLCPQTVWTDLYQTIDRFFAARDRHEQSSRRRAPRASTWFGSSWPGGPAAPGYSISQTRRRWCTILR